MIILSYDLLRGVSPTASKHVSLFLSKKYYEIITKIPKPKILVGKSVYTTKSVEMNFSVCRVFPGQLNLQKNLRTPPDLNNS